MELYGRDSAGNIVNPYVAGTIVTPGLVDSVYTETARPDLVAETLSAVINATLRMHCIDFWYKDINSAQIVFDAAGYVQVLDTTALPRFRSISYMRKNDPSLATYQQNPSILPPLTASFAGIPLSILLTMGFLKILTPTDILDDYGAEKLDVAYQVGSSIMLKSSTSLQYVLAGWYAYPNVDTKNNGLNFDSWIAREMPYAIIYAATSQIFQTIGQNDTSRKYDAPASRDFDGGLVQQQIRMLQISNTVAQGY
jgi:hypothetical protein